MQLAPAQQVANRMAELEAELEQSKQQCAEDKQQCAEDKSLNAAAVLARLRQGTIKVVF